jgi:hypothetical protein
MKTTYQNWNDRLTGRCKDRRKVANNTYLERRAATFTIKGKTTGIGSIALKLHNTDIMTAYPDNTVTLNTGGWRTITTKARMNDFLPFGRIYQKDSIWYLSLGNVDHVYDDGIELSETDYTVSYTGEPPADPKATRKIKRTIRKFSNDYISALLAGNVPAPSGGDCWHCLMFDKDGASINTEHLTSHMSKEERYFVPSLLNNAIKAFSVSIAAKYTLAHHWSDDRLKDKAIAMVFEQEGIASAQLTKSLTRYLYRKFEIAS